MTPPGGFGGARHHPPAQPTRPVHGSPAIHDAAGASADDLAADLDAATIEGDTANGTDPQGGLDTISAQRGHGTDRESPDRAGRR